MRSANRVEHYPTSTYIRLEKHGMERSKELIPTTSGNWSMFLADPRGLRSLYSEAPELTELHELVLVRDGPRLDLRIELDRMPDPLPKKWAAERCNRVQVILRLSYVRDLVVGGWGTTNLINARFFGAPSDFRFELMGANTRIAGSASHMLVDRFGGYQSADES